MPNAKREEIVMNEIGMDKEELRRQLMMGYMEMAEMNREMANSVCAAEDQSEMVTLEFLKQ